MKRAIEKMSQMTQNKPKMPIPDLHDTPFTRFQNKTIRKKYKSNIIFKFFVLL
jgi:hypothetical protein